MPPKVEYQLTFEGSQIAARVNQLIEYLEQHLPETSQQPSHLMDYSSFREVAVDVPTPKHILDVLNSASM